MGVLQATLGAVHVGVVTLWEGLYMQFQDRDEDGISTDVVMKDWVWKGCGKAKKDDGGRLAIIMASRDKPSGVITAGVVRRGRRKRA